MIVNLQEFVKKTAPESIFLWLAAPLIAILILIIPSLTGFDESTHFLRAYQVSTGDFIAERFGNHFGGPIPINVSNMSDMGVIDVQQYGHLKKANVRYYKYYLVHSKPSTNIVNKYFTASSVYSPVSYAPQSVGIYLARSLRLPLLSYVYIGRIFNAAAFIALAYLAIRLTPRGKWAFMAVALLPTSLTAAASLSPDAMINGAAILLVALFIKAVLGKNTLSNRNLVGIAGVIFLLSLTKQSYFVLGLLMLFLPPKKVFGSFRRYVIWNLFFIILALFLTLAWDAQVRDAIKYSSIEFQPSAHINATEQEKYILHHPLTYTGTMLRQILGHLNSQYKSMVGQFTWKGILTPEIGLFITYLGLLLAGVISFYENKIQPQITRYQKSIVRFGPVLLAIAMVCLINTGLYLTYNLVGSEGIGGVQGRYFIPLLPLLIPFLILGRNSSSPIMKFDQTRAGTLLITIFLLQNLVAIIAIFGSNYINGIQFY